MESSENVHEKTLDYTEGYTNERRRFEKTLEELKCEVEEMKWRRVEDMKANERVLAIFATKEEAWKKEKKQLMQELDALREIENCNNGREIENWNNSREIEKINNGTCSQENGSSNVEIEAGCSNERGGRNHSIDELMDKLGKEVERRKMAFKKFVAVVSEIKGQKNKVENMLRAAVLDMGAYKKEAAMKAKEKRHVDAALRKVTEEILRLQKEVDDKDSVIDQMCQKKEAVMGVRDFLEAELRAKELELSNAKIMLKEYADCEWNREREVEKWKKLYLSIKLQLDNLQMGSRQSSGLLENGHSSGGEGGRNRTGSRSRSRSGRVETTDLEEKIRCLENEIEAKNERVEGLRRKFTMMEKEMHRKDKEIEIVRQSMNKAREGKVEVQRDAIYMNQMFSSCPLLLQKSKSCNNHDHILKDTRQKGGNQKNNGNGNGVGPLGIAWAFGAMMFVLVYCTTEISGGHINPAITFALFLARKVSLPRAIMYILAQCVGAISGVALVDWFQKAFYVSSGGGVNTVQQGYSKTAGLLTEIIGTFVLVYTVFSAIDHKRKARGSHVPVLAPLPIGFAVFAVHLASIPITGTGINPARSFGPAIVYGRKQPWNDQWIFWVGPLIGATIAATYHHYVLHAGGIKPWGFRRSHSSTLV